MTDLKKMLTFLEGKDCNSESLNRAITNLRLYIETKQARYKLVYQRALNEWSKETKTTRPKPRMLTARDIAISNRSEARFNYLKATSPNYAQGFIEC